MSVTAAQGFTAGGVAARISKLGPDLALVAGNRDCVGAGMFTANRVQAAPVVVSKEHLERAEPQAVVINSGNANAATGAQGIADAHATAEKTARVLGLQPEQVLVLSTGVIGVPLPMERVLSGIANAASAPPPVDSTAEALSRPASSRSSGSGTPMTPVERTSTSSVRRPRRCAARAAAARASLTPRAPVAALAFPELITTACGCACWR